jgi:membrane-associated protease RseP (regulator of RpoE activity)
MDSSQPILVTPEAPRLPEPFYAVPQTFPRQRLWLHALLYILTILSTWFAAGPVFSAGLLSILTAHEFGHYFTARRYRVPVSLPYFIPFPISLFGTLGAVIRMSPRIPNRRALFDIAAAGPLAGMVLALPITYLGIARSAIVAKSAIPAHTITLGEPLLFKGLGWLVHGALPKNVDLMLDPLAFAGWAGMFVTALNLLPIGQLDGGHITHALFGNRSRLVAGAMFLGLGLYCIVTKNVTWVPLLLLLLIFGVQHPPVMDDGNPLGGGRRAVGILLGILFLTCFSLVPIQL